MFIQRRLSLTTLAIPSVETLDPTFLGDQIVLSLSSSKVTPAWEKGKEGERRRMGGSPWGSLWWWWTDGGLRAELKGRAEVRQVRVLADT